MRIVDRLLSVTALLLFVLVVAAVLATPAHAQQPLKPIGYRQVCDGGRCRLEPVYEPLMSVVPTSLSREQAAPQIVQASQVKAQCACGESCPCAPQRMPIASGPVFASPPLAPPRPVLNAVQSIACQRPVLGLVSKIRAGFRNRLRCGLLGRRP